jgi:3'-phosphoadenosine 5'-phosphosulfate sulfotransferase (PAPS reductase)/FAD synthetase
MLEPMGTSSYSDIKDSLGHRYLEGPRPWLVGFSGGKDSTMLALLNHLLHTPYANVGCAEWLIPRESSARNSSNPPFGGWTCTVLSRDKASKGPISNDHKRIERLVEFRETLVVSQDSANGRRDLKRKNGRKNGARRAEGLIRSQTIRCQRFFPQAMNTDICGLERRETREVCAIP